MCCHQFILDRCPFVSAQQHNISQSVFSTEKCWTIIVVDNCPTDQQINNKNVTIYDVGIGRGKIGKFQDNSKLRIIENVIEWRKYNRNMVNWMIMVFVTVSRIAKDEIEPKIEDDILLKKLEIQFFPFLYSQPRCARRERSFEWRELSHTFIIILDMENYIYSQQIEGRRSLHESNFFPSFYCCRCCCCCHS